MIIDKIDNCHVYKNLGKRFAQAFEFLELSDCKTLPAGKYEISGNRVFALVQDYYTLSEDKLTWEAHRKYVDLQYIVKGIEIMGYSNVENMEPVSEYIEQDDYILFKGKGIYFPVAEKCFTIFFPHDCHRVRIKAGDSCQVRKIVIKILY
ncbi:MAG: YhcH/YjgK/YiaL family protein [Candidatus Ratteibacteria bacterium]